MSIERALGLEPEGPTLKRLEALWPIWAIEDPRLSVTSFERLRAFRRTGDPHQVWELASALAAMASVEGGDDVDAAAALAWVLLPGVVTLSRGLREWANHASPNWVYEGENLDSLVAGELWQAIREFPADRLGNVVGNLLARTRYACRLRLGDPDQLRRRDPAWADTFLVDATDRLDRAASRDGECGDPTPTRLAGQTLLTAIEADWIDLEEAALLFDVAERVDALGYNLGRSAGGLTSHQVAAQLAALEGTSTSTVRRRIDRVLGILRAHRDDLTDAA